jgi:hypothetical protein
MIHKPKPQCSKQLMNTTASPIGHPNDRSPPNERRSSRRPIGISRHRAVLRDTRCTGMCADHGLACHPARCEQATSALHSARILDALRAAIAEQIPRCAWRIIRFTRDALTDDRILNQRRNLQFNIHRNENTNSSRRIPHLHNWNCG